jgi:hypothetical protein
MRKVSIRGYPSKGFRGDAGRPCRVGGSGRRGAAERRGGVHVDHRCRGGQGGVIQVVALVATSFATVCCCRELTWARAVVDGAPRRSVGIPTLELPAGGGHPLWGGRKLFRVTYQHRQDRWVGRAAPPPPSPRYQPVCPPPAPPLGPPSPPHSTAAFPPAPSVKRTVTVAQAIPFATQTVNDPSIARGMTTVRISGVPGVKTLTYEVTFRNGVQTGMELVDEVINEAPVAQVIAIGTQDTSYGDSQHVGESADRRR